MKRFLRFLIEQPVLLFCLAATITYCSVSAIRLAAQEAIHIDSTQVLLDLDGKPLDGPATGVPATFGYVAKQALTGAVPGDDKLSDSTKWDRWELAKKVYPPRKDAILNLDEITSIKERIGKAYPASAVVGPAWEIIAQAIGKGKPETKTKEGSK
jgi:hypothetical protein